MVSETTKRMPFPIWIRRVTAVFLALTYIVLMIGIIQLATIPSKYLLVTLPLYGLLTALLVWVLFDTKKLAKRQVILAVLAVISLVLAGINMYATSVIHSAESLLSNIQEKQSRYIEYSIVTNSTDAVTVEEAGRVAIISTDPLYDKARTVLAQETPTEQQPVEHLAHVKNVLVDSEVDLAAVRTESLQLVNDEDSAFYKTLTVLRTFRVEIDPNEPTETLDATKPYIVYISGIDTYGAVSTTSRSDVNILMVVNPAKRKLLLVNTPRDYYVQLHGTTGTFDKLTHAGVYGVDMSRQTLEDLYGVTIPYYARINFTSLVNVIDAIGPISVYSDYDFKSYQSGYNTLNSKQALEFSRERKSFEEGDRQRGRNQQHVIEAIIAKMARPENSVKLPQIMNSVQQSVETNISETSLKSIIRNQLDDIRSWSVESISVDGNGNMLPTYSYGDTPLYVMIRDQASVESAQQKIASYFQ